jgi:hypothetical protein
MGGSGLWAIRASDFLFVSGLRLRSSGDDDRVSFEHLEPVSDVSVGDWIAARISDFGSRVGDVVPTGFDAYARVLHPAQDEQGHMVTWAEACRRTGQTPHATVLWGSISPTIQESRTTGRWPFRQTVRSSTTTWQGREPAEGNMPASILAEVLEVLDRFTATGSDCYHAVWEGWSWLNAGPMRLRRGRFGRRAGPVVAPAGGLPPDVLVGPRFRLPGRDYLLFRGPLRAALSIGVQESDGRAEGQAPNLLWPADGSWCLGIEIDFDSTLIGGSPQLIEALLKTPGLEAWPVAATDDLTPDRGW